MERQESLRAAGALLKQGLSDEDVERLTQVSLLDIVELRAKSASAPWPGRRDLDAVASLTPDPRR